MRWRRAIGLTVAALLAGAAGPAWAFGPPSPGSPPSPNWRDQVIFRPGSTPADLPPWFASLRRAGVTTLWLASPLDSAAVRALHAQGLYEVVDADDAALMRALLVQSFVDGAYVGRVSDRTTAFWTALSSVPYADPPGVLAEAKTLGKAGFLVFGSVDPQVDALAQTLASPEHKDLTMVLNEPLRVALDAVFAHGAATRLLTNCLVAEQRQLLDPTALMNSWGGAFLDQQTDAPALVPVALAVLFAIPGVPTLEASGPHLEDDSASLIKTLSGLRLLEPELSRGQFVPVSDSASAGVLAFLRILGNRVALVVVNTSAETRVFSQAATQLPEKTVLTRVYGWHDSLSVDAAEWVGSRRTATVTVGAGGGVTAVAAPYSVGIWAVDAVRDSTLAPIQVLWGLHEGADHGLSGTVPSGLTELRLIVDGNLDDRIPLIPDSSRSWRSALPAAARRPGVHTIQVIARDEAGAMVVSEPLTITSD